MKPAPFEYFAPQNVHEALALLDQHGDEAKVLAGGQSLMPLMNLRLARPKVVIDIGRLSELQSILSVGTGDLTIGAFTRQRTVERSDLIQRENPLLAATIPLIAHAQIRNRGTIGGSIAHADPAAELPALSIALEAEFTVRSARGQRVINSQDFFRGYMTTALEPTELLTEIRIPSWDPRLGWAVGEVSRRDGDFALVGAMVLLRFDVSDLCEQARIVLFGVGAAPVRMHQAEEMLRGRRADEKAVAEAARMVSEDLDPISDIHASAEYRKDVAGALTRKFLMQALARAREAKTK
jgi:carbon-monoxide dehydrogenase medium subunit